MLMFLLIKYYSLPQLLLLSTYIVLTLNYIVNLFPKTVDLLSRKL